MTVSIKLFSKSVYDETVGLQYSLDNFAYSINMTDLSVSYSVATYTDEILSRRIK